jgi:hypothetical protein
MLPNQQTTAILTASMTARVQHGSHATHRTVVSVEISTITQLHVMPKKKNQLF